MAEREGFPARGGSAFGGHAARGKPPGDIYSKERIMYKINWKKNLKIKKINPFGGERGIRTPGPLRDNGFQDRRDQPDSAISPPKGLIISNE